MIYINFDLSDSHRDRRVSNEIRYQRKQKTDLKVHAFNFDLLMNIRISIGIVCKGRMKIDAKWISRDTQRKELDKSVTDIKGKQASQPSGGKDFQRLGPSSAIFSSAFVFFPPHNSRGTLMNISIPVIHCPFASNRSRMLCCRRVFQKDVIRKQIILGKKVVLTDFFVFFFLIVYCILNLIFTYLVFTWMFEPILHC